MKRRIRAAALGLLLLSAFVPETTAQPMVTLQPGDIIVLDILDDAVYHVDPVTGLVVTLTSGWDVKSPRGVALSPEGKLFVSDTYNEWVLRIDPNSGETTFVALVSASGIPSPAAMIADEVSGWDLLLMEADGRKSVV